MLGARFHRAVLAAALVSFLTLGVQILTARAAVPGLSLTWNDCPGGISASSGITNACNSDADTLQLVCSVVVQNTITGVIGAELVVDMQSADATQIPDWWRMDGSGAAGCRAGLLDTGFDFTANPACNDPWHGNAFGGNQGFAVGPPAHPFLNQARILEVAAVTSNDAVTLTAGTTYALLKLVINTARTVSASCAGCGESACLVFNSVLLRVLPASGSDVTINTPAGVGTNWATFQGTAANCSAVPVRHTTWGAIKSLYH